MPTKVSGPRRGATGASAHKKKRHSKPRRSKPSHSGVKHLSKTLLKKLDNRYVNDDELERKICPFWNSTRWALEVISVQPPLFPEGSQTAGFAPASLTDPTGGDAFQICGNVFQFGRALTSDLSAYNAVTNPTPGTNYTDACYAIGGLDWYNATTGGAVTLGTGGSGAVLPIGTNPTRVMDGQYFNMGNSLIKMKISLSISDSETYSYYVNPIHFRVIHVTMKRGDAPLGKIKSVTKALFLDEYGASRGIENCFDQTANQAVTKQSILEYGVDQRYYKVHQDTRFSLMNQFLDVGGDLATYSAISTLNNANSLPSCPSQKEIVFKRRWGNKKVLFRPSAEANAAADGLYEPADENCKDMIIVIAVRGNNQYSSRQLASVNLGDAGTAGTTFQVPGYQCNFWGLTTGKDP